MVNKRYQWITFVIVSVLLMSALLFADSTLHAQSGRTFPETGKSVGGIFLRHWNTHGGLAQQGYPISEEIQEQSLTDGKVYRVQYFQRAVFEHHPEYAGSEAEVLLSLLGVFHYNEKYGGKAPGQQASTSNPRHFTETGKTMGGAFRKYWETHGGLAQQGYPISDEFQEVDKDGILRTVQYFERAVFEYHEEYAGTPNEVLLSLLGVSYYERKYGGGAPHPTSLPSPPPDVPSPTKAPPQPTQPPTNNKGQIFFYIQDTREYAVGEINALGIYEDLTTGTTDSDLVGNDGVITAVGNGRLLFYNMSTGLATVGQIANDGTFTIVGSSDALGPGWRYVASAGNGLILYYRSGAPIGTVQGGSARLNTNGTITRLKEFTSSTLEPGYRHVVGLNNRVLLFYNQDTDFAVTRRLDNDGNLVNLKNFNPGLNPFIRITAQASGDVVLFSTGGSGSTYLSKTARINPDGTYTPLMSYPDPANGNPPLPPGHSNIAGMNTGSLLFYNYQNARTAFMGDDGRIVLQQDYPGFFKVWGYTVGIK